MRDYHETLAGGPWDCIIADFPWAYTQGITHATQKELVPYPTLVDPLDFFTAAYVALVPDRNLWVWSDWYTLPRLLLAAQQVGFTYRGLCVVKRRNLGLGYLLRKQIYFLPLWSKGKAYRNPDAWLSEYLGDYRCPRSHKPPEVYQRLLAHSLPPGGRWIDPFPATHTDMPRHPLPERMSLWPICER